MPASVLNTNLGSMIARRNLAGAQTRLSESVERLSSGLGINRAKDDAAGMAVSSVIEGQTRVAATAHRNVNDAMSMVQTAEGALQEANGMLTRIKELATQGANDSMSRDQYYFLVQEMRQIMEELANTAERTTFNDNKLLGGSPFSKITKVQTITETIPNPALEPNQDPTLKLQFTAGMEKQLLNVGDSSLSPMVGSYWGGPTHSISFPAGSIITAAAGWLGNDAGGPLARNITLPLYQDASNPNYFYIPGWHFMSQIYRAIDQKAFDDYSYTNSTGAFPNGDGDDWYMVELVNGVLQYHPSQQSGGFNTPAELNYNFADATIQNLGVGGWNIDSTNARRASAGFDPIPATITRTTVTTEPATIEFNDWQFLSGAGKDDAIRLDGIPIWDTAQSAAARNNGAGYADGAVKVGALSALYQRILWLADTANSPLETGNGYDIFSKNAQGVTGAPDQQVYGPSGGLVSALTKSLNELVDDSLLQINAHRSYFGAYAGRMEHNIANLAAQSENLTAAGSRIRDTDYGAETASLTRTQILQQAATAMLAQANAMPNVVLALLRQQ